MHSSLGKESQTEVISVRKTIFLYLLQALLLLLLTAGAIGLRMVRLDDATILPEERIHMALTAETASPEVLGEERTLFHPIAREAIAFMNEYRAHTPLRYYRLMPLAASILTLLLCPGLGLRRRGGLLETTDALYWAMAFMVVTPASILMARTFTPAAWGGLVLMGILITMRAYAQWPSLFAGILFALLNVLLVALEPNAVWLVGALLLSIVIGVGWRRICLYWQTWHCLAALLAAAVFAGLLAACDLLYLPALPVIPTDFGAEFLQRLTCFTYYGVGLLLWGWITTWAFMRSDRRFARVISLLFLLSFWGSFFFHHGGIFAIPLTLVMPLIGALAISTAPNASGRWIGGHCLLALLCILTLMGVHACIR